MFRLAYHFTVMALISSRSFTALYLPQLSGATAKLNDQRAALQAMDAEHNNKQAALRDIMTTHSKRSVEAQMELENIHAKLGHAMEMQALQEENNELRQRVTELGQVCFISRVSLRSGHQWHS